MKTQIEYVIYSDHLLDMAGVTAADCQAYEAALVDALAERFPDAETSVDLKDDVSGHGAGSIVEAGDDEPLNRWILADQVDQCANATLRGILERKL